MAQIRVVKGYNVDVQVGMKFRESTSTIVLSTTVRGSAARISDLTQGESFRFDNIRSPGQRFGDALR
jgi:hypothetical protein